MRHITITGSLGSGKSAVSSIMKEQLGLEIESIGRLQRKMAEEYGMSTNDFNKYMETHPEIDHQLDDIVKNQGLSSPPKIFDSRLAWYFIPQSFKIYLYVKDEIAAERIFNDPKRINEKYTNLDTTLKNIIQRRSSEVHRFKTQYNVDLENYSNYDLIVDTSYLSSPEIADIIITAYKKQEPNRREVWLSPYTLYPTQKIQNHSIEKIKQISPFYNTIKAHIDNPIQVIVCDEKFYIYDGHKRVLNSILNHYSLLPCNLINSYDSDILPFSQTAKEYIENNYSDKIYSDWNDFIELLRK